MSDHELAINQLAAQGVPDRAQELAQLFPEAMTDGKVDVEKLKLLLGENVEESQERYGLTWPGKRDAIRLAQKQSTATLEPMPDESVDWDSTKNLIIEGDNLEVLKLLQKSYYGQVKLIYIDPPYNTGKDFVYEDDFAEPTVGYLTRSGQLDGSGFRTSSNKETSGRFHSGWLTMMASRLTLARGMLREDGVIFVSIDDSEIHHLRLLLDEVFGADNHLGTVSWKKKTNGNNVGALPPVHDYIMVYAKNEELNGVVGLPIPEAKISSTYGNPDNDSRGPWTTSDLSANHEGPLFGIENPKTGVVHWPAEGRYWVFNQGEVERRISDGRIIFGKSGMAAPVQKKFLSDRSSTRFKVGTWWDSVALNSDATEELRDLLGRPKVFDHPKPTKLIKQIICMATNPEEGDLVVDFFAGSGTSGEAVMQLNNEDDGNRRFLLVQLDEEITGSESEAAKLVEDLGLASHISSLTRERVRRAGKKVREEAGLTRNDLDTGFRAFKLSESNFKNWDADAETLLAEDLEAFVNNINTNASDDGIVHEILLKAGIRLDTDLTTVQVAGNDVTLAVEGLVAVSANRSITQEFVDGLLALEPQIQQVYLLDSGFGSNDSLKVNTRHQFAARRSESDPDKDDALRTV